MWAPGESFDANHTTRTGTWEQCGDQPLQGPQVRTMTFLWREVNHDWGGAAGVRDSIAIEQSYPEHPEIRQIYYYARGWGLIRWEHVHDGQPAERRFADFNQHSAEAPAPCASQCAAATAGVDACPCAATCDHTKICGVSDNGCGSTCQVGSGCQNGLEVGQSLARGDDCIDSVGGTASLCHQADGNIVVYDRFSQPVWYTSTYGQATTALAMQEDGNLVLYNRFNPVWQSRTGGHAADDFVAVIQDDCNLVIYNSGGAAVWNSGQLCP